MHDDIQYYCQRGEALKSDRGNFETQWEESAKRVIPEHTGSFISRQHHNLNGSAGQKHTQDMYDATPVLACQRFSAVIESLISPQNSYWSYIRPADEKLSDNRSAREYFEDVNNLLFKYRYRPVANFVSNTQKAYMGIGAYGNGIIYVDTPDDTTGLRYRNIHLGEIYFIEDHAGVVDGAYRYFRMKADDIARGFPNVPDSVMKKAGNPQQKDEQLEILHVVERNPNQIPGFLGPEGMRYRSVYILIQEKVKLKQDGGYMSFPYAVARYTQAPNEMYGRGPAQMVLPSIKVLNQQKKDYLTEASRKLRPVLLANDDGALNSFTLKEGAINQGGISKDGKRLIDVLPTGDLREGENMMNMERQAINDAFLVNLFQILIETPRMTATEVLERAREKGMLIAPTAGRLQSEFLGGMIERELDLLNQQGLLPDPPPILQSEEALQYRIEYASPLTRMREAEQAAGWNRALQETLNFVQITGDLSPLDWFNADVATPRIQQINGAPVDWTRSEEEVQAMREARQKKQEQAEMAQMAPAAAQVMTAGAKVTEAQKK